MRVSVLLLVAALGLGLAVPAQAGDTPDFTSDALIFVQDDLPEGWTLIDDEEDLPAGLPTEDALTECAGDAVDSFELTVEYRLIQHSSGTKAVVAIIDVDVEDGPEAYTAALNTAATASGWTVTALAHPTRLLVIAGQPADVQMLTTWHVDVAARKLCEMAYFRILSDHASGKPGRISQERAQEYVVAADKIVPGIKGAVVIQGLLKLYRGEDVDGFITLDKGTKGGGPLAADEGLVAFALVMQARYMLKKKRADFDSDAVDVLNRAIGMQEVYYKEANRFDAPSLRWLAFENRYNLGCAQARLKQMDAAFETTKEAFELGQMILGAGRYLHSFRQLLFWDDDFEPLRQDAERFEQLTQELAPEEFDWKKEREVAEKEKERRAKAKADAAAAGGSTGTGDPK